MGDQRARMNPVLAYSVRGSFVRGHPHRRIRSQLGIPLWMRPTRSRVFGGVILLYPERLVIILSYRAARTSDIVESTSEGGIGMRGGGKLAG